MWLKIRSEFINLNNVKNIEFTYRDSYNGNKVPEARTFNTMYIDNTRYDLTNAECKEIINSLMRDLEMIRIV